MNFSEARDKCQQNNYTDLVTVYDNEDNQELVKLLSNNNTSHAWIGAYMGARWSDGAEVTFRNITCYNEKWCATMKAFGDWECINCNEGKNFTCYDRGKHMKLFSKNDFFLKSL